MHLIKKNQGQGLIEYLILVAIMAIATMGVIRVVSQNTAAKFAKISQVLHGKSEAKADANTKLDSVNESDIKKKDFGDFYRGAISHGNSK